MNPQPYDTDSSVATYYVVPTRPKMGPIEPTLEHAQSCAYYVYTPTPQAQENWTLLKDPKKQIVANNQSNYVCLVQLTDADLDINGPKLPVPVGMVFESDVTLYGAAARTLTGNSCGPITDLFLANFTDQRPDVEKHVSDSLLRPTVMIPVAPGNTRGLVLIFTVTGEKGKASPGLRATFDPEIKGSTRH